MAHVHAELNPELLRQIADDLEERPSEPCWETYYEDGPEWMACKPSHVLLSVSNGHKVRRKPTTITRTVTVPKARNYGLGFSGQDAPAIENTVRVMQADGFYELFEYESKEEANQVAKIVSSLCLGVIDDE